MTRRKTRAELIKENFELRDTVKKLRFILQQLEEIREKEDA